MVSPVRFPVVRTGTGRRGNSALGAEEPRCCAGRAPTATCRAQFWCGFAQIVHVCMRLSCLARSRGGSVRQPSGPPTNAHRLFLNVLLSCPRCTTQTKPPVLHGLQPSKVLCTFFARRREPKGFLKYQPRIAGRMMLLISSSSRAAAMRPCRKMPGSHLPQTSCGKTTQSCASSTCTCPLPCCVVCATNLSCSPRPGLPTASASLEPQSVHRWHIPLALGLIYFDLDWYQCAKLVSMQGFEHVGLSLFLCAPGVCNCQH